METWKLTDASVHQYGRSLGDRVFEFKEFNRNLYGINTIDYPDEETFIDTIFDNRNGWASEVIDLKEYSEEQIRYYTESYYDSLEQLKEIYGDNSDFIIAECIFEQINELMIY